MEKFVEQTFLFDFYGELLTERQRQVYTSVVFEDYSLSEVAEELGISRQGVHDMIRRCNRTLEEYEEKWRKSISATTLDFQLDEETGRTKVRDGSREIIGGMITSKMIKYTLLS